MPLKRLVLSVLAVATTLAATSCAHGGDKNYRVEIQTPYGTMKARLYDDTPRHRDNFIRLVEQGAYDSLLFHRVIRGFVIQGGDPTSPHAPQTASLGEKSIGDNIPAEIVYPAHIHKRGALAAARQPDSVNPERASSGSQFYIVQGQRQSAEQLGETETIHNNKVRAQIYKEIIKFYSDSLQALQDAGKAKEMSELHFRIVEKVEEIGKDRGEIRQIPDDVKRTYMEEGGLPHLDMEYTVFGEVYEGLNVIDSIASIAVRPPSMRPGQDIWMVIRPLQE